MILIPNLVLGVLTDNLESHQFFEVGKKKNVRLLYLYCFNNNDSFILY